MQSKISKLLYLKTFGDHKLTTGRKLTQYNVGTQTRRTPNNIWGMDDVLEIHPIDASTREIGRAHV